MAYTKVTVNLPEIKKPFTCCNGVNYSDPSTKKYNINLVKETNRKYGNLFDYWGNVFEIPKGVLLAFSCIESGGEMVGPNKYEATGLMQVTPITIYGTASDTKDWAKVVGGSLPQAAVNELNSKVPGIFTGSLASVKARILNKLQYDASFSIMSGALVLRWLLEKYGHLNKAVVGYNSSPFQKTIAKLKRIPVDTTSLYNMPIPKETKAYLLKLMGVDSFLTIIYFDKVI